MIKSDQTPRDQIVLHLPRLRAFALGLTRNPDRADDLVQDTVEKAWVHIASFTPGTNLCGWLCTILRNTHYSNLRKTWREVPDSDGIVVGGLSVPPAHDGVLALREFMVAFDLLSAEHRDVLGLVGVLGCSYEEASAVLSVPVGTVKSRVSRARALLDVQLSRDETPPRPAPAPRRDPAATGKARPVQGRPGLQAQPVPALSA